MPRTIRPLFASLLVALAVPAGASAQTQTETAPLGDYTQTTPTQTETTPLGDYTQTTPTQTETTPADNDDSGTLEEDTGVDDTGGGAGGGGQAESTTPAQTTGQPEALAFTGFEAFAVGLLGLALMGGAVVLQRRRRA